MSDMKRVGLIFDAHGVSDFKSALKSVNSELNHNRNEFKLVKAQWDDNTKSSRKLADTQKYLSKQYKESSDRVELLKAELEKMKTEEGNNEKAIKKKEDALIKAQTTMIRYKNGLDEVNEKIKAGTADIEAYAKKLENIGNNTAKVGEGLTKHVTAPIAATGAAAMVAWNEIDDAYDNIVAGTGATGEALQSLQDSFDNVFGDFPASSQEVSTAIADINTRFGFVDKKLEQASTSFLQFARVNNTDVSTAIKLVSRAMGDAGVEADDYSEVLDALTTASQGSGISIDRLAELITKYGAPMRALGYDMQESIALFAQWEKAGVTQEIAFSGMKKAISNFAKEGKNAKVEFRKVLEEIQRCPDIASATTKAIEVFGAKAGPDLADAIQGGKFSIEEFAKTMESSTGRVQESFENMQDPPDKARIALNNLKLAGAELGGTLLGGLSPIISTISESIKDFTKWFKELDPAIKNVIVVIGILAAAIGPLLVIVGHMITGIGTSITFFTKLMTSVGGLSGAFTFLTGPIAAVIAIVIACTAAVIDLWNNNEQFRTAVINIMNNIMSVLKTLWEVIVKPILDSIIDLLLSVWHDALVPLWNAFKQFVNIVTQVVSQIITVIQPLVTWFIKKFGPPIANVIKDVINVLKNIIQFVKNVFTGNWRGAWNNVVSIFRTIFNRIVGYAKTPINSVIGFVNGMIAAVEGGVNSVISALNSISVTVPKWVPGVGGKHFGFDLGYVGLGRIPMLAKGGTLLNGMAMVAEAGPELLLQQGNSTKVVPLSNSSKNKTEIIDYDRLTLALIKALKTLKIVLDKEEVGEFVDERLLEAM